ncbi:TPA: protein-export chaperone SecB [Bacillus cereus]|nr:protein-export chaperone SecB [Bacillus cereus]
MDRAFQIYKFSRTNIQMKAVSLEEASVFKKIEQVKGKYITGINFGKHVEVKTATIAFAYLKTDVELRDPETEEIVVGIEVVYKGRFEANEEMEKQEFEQWVDVQVVPQLLPYVRSYVTNTTSAMAIPQINIPTMDILETIKKNDYHDVDEDL